MVNFLASSNLNNLQKFIETEFATVWQFIHSVAVERKVTFALALIYADYFVSVKYFPLISTPVCSNGIQVQHIMINSINIQYLQH